MARRLVSIDRDEFRLVRPLTQRTERRRILAEVVASAAQTTPRAAAPRDTICIDLPRDVEATPATRQTFTLS